ncbi:hypothetical protein BDI4_1980002 [Burkholderia diffusa]|nr:hypothetical protein BDI4_1980002 [Burkholderia diffusa]
MTDFQKIALLYVHQIARVIFNIASQARYYAFVFQPFTQKTNQLPPSTLSLFCEYIICSLPTPIRYKRARHFLALIAYIHPPPKNLRRNRKFPDK